MSTNEMYLDSACRSNIVSLAKMLGYTLSCKSTQEGSINLVVNDGSGTSITMSKEQFFQV